MEKTKDCSLKVSKLDLIKLKANINGLYHLLKDLGVYPEQYSDEYCIIESTFKRMGITSKAVEKFLLSDIVCKTLTEVEPKPTNKLFNIDDVIRVLETLGYTQDDINFALAHLDSYLNPNWETSEIVSLAIKIIHVKNESTVEAQ